MSEFREPKLKVCEVDINKFLKNVFGGPPRYRIWIDGRYHIGEDFMKQKQRG